MEIKQWMRIFKALGDENRLKILACIIEREELCVCELQALLDLSQPTVSRHLKILEDAGFLEGKRQGQWVIYCLCPRGKFEQRLVFLIKDFLSQDKDLSSLLKKAKKINLR